MRRVLRTAVVFFGLTLLTSPANANPSVEEFIGQCVGQSVVAATLKCVQSNGYDGSALLYEVIGGRKLVVTATGGFGNYKKRFVVNRIQHLPPRLTDVGAMDHSIRFVGGGVWGMATVTVPCNQTRLATVGIDTTVPEGSYPNEYVAQCQVI